jgi:hypothetical protein
MADLQGSLPIDPTDLDEITPVDMELVREHMKGDEAFIEQLQESLRPLYVFLRLIRATLLTRSSTRFRRDERTWRHRLADFHQSWMPLMDGMADAYLRWKHPEDPDLNGLPVNSGETQDPPPSCESSFTTAVTPSSTNNDPPPLDPTRDGKAIGTPDPTAPTEVEITVIDIYTLSTSVKFSCEGDQTTASTLAGLGFIGNAPFSPSVAVSIKTLELYRILRRRKPSFSVEGFVKVISDLYMVCTSFVTYSTIPNL